MQYFRFSIPWSRLAAPAGLLAFLACSAPDRGPTLQRRETELFGPPPSADEPPLAMDIRQVRTLPEFLRHGLLYNAGLRSAFEVWLAEVEGIDRAGTLPDPRFTFAYFVEEIQTRTGPQEGRLSFSQTLPWFGKREGDRDLQTHRAHAAWERARGMRLQLERRIRVEFHEYAFMGKQIELLRDDQRLLEQLLAIADQRFTSGRGRREDLLRLNIEIGILEDSIRGLEDRRPAMSARLVALLNLPDPVVFEYPELMLPETVPLDVAQVQAQAGRQNPRVLELRERIQEAAVAGDLADRDGFPDLTVGLDYYVTSRASTPVSGSGDDPVAVTMGINLPVWRSSIDAARRETERRHDAVCLQLADVLTELRAQVEWEVYEVQDATRRMTLYRHTLIPQMEETLEVLRASYSAGTAPVDELLEAERVLLSFEIAYWRACKDRRQGEARLTALCGGSLES